MRQDPHIKRLAAEAGQVMLAAEAPGEVGAVAAPVQGRSRAPIDAPATAAPIGFLVLQRCRCSVVCCAVHCTSSFTNALINGTKTRAILRCMGT